MTLPTLIYDICYIIHFHNPFPWLGSNCWMEFINFSDINLLQCQWYKVNFCMQAGLNDVSIVHLVSLGKTF